MSSSSGSDESDWIKITKKIVVKHKDFSKDKIYKKTRTITASHFEKAIFTIGNRDCYKKVADADSRGRYKIKCHKPAILLNNYFRSFLSVVGFNIFLTGTI